MREFRNHFYVPKIELSTLTAAEVKLIERCGKFSKIQVLQAILELDCISSETKLITSSVSPLSESAATRHCQLSTQEFGAT